MQGDPLNTLGQGETIMFAGGGSLSSTGNRWGDFSMLTIDPIDDCTFWYTNEIYRTSSSNAWSTGIGAFKFAACGVALNSAITGGNLGGLPPVGRGHGERKRVGQPLMLGPGDVRREDRNNHGHEVHATVGHALSVVALSRNVQRYLSRK